MAKGAAIRFTSYGETVPKILNLLKVGNELKKYDKIVLKPYLSSKNDNATPVELVEEVLKYCHQNKNPVAEIFIAEGADGEDTNDLFVKLGYQTLAEKHDVSLVDLNETETDLVEMDGTLRFDRINYPTLLMESFVISLPKLGEDGETGIAGSLSNMLGAYPARYYSGFFSSTKNKLRKSPIKFAIHDSLKCKMPNLALLDATEQGSILAGLPLEIDKQAAKLLGHDWKNISYLSLAHDSFTEEEPTL